MRTLDVLAAVFLASALALPARGDSGQDEPTREFAFSPGLAIPVGPQRHSRGAAFAFESSLGWQNLDVLETGADGGYYSSAQPVLRAGGFAKLGPWLQATDQASMRPYVVLGGGLYAEFGKGGEASWSGLRPDVSAPGSLNAYLGVNAGAGWEMTFSDGGAIGLEVSYHRFFRPGGDYVAVVPALNLSYRF